jgi:hypothetical protein
MALFQRIAAAAGTHIVRAGGMDLIAARDMLLFLDSALRMRVGILGIEGFRLRAGSVIADLNAVADYSVFAADPGFVDRSNAEARGFLAIAGREAHYYKVAILGRNPLTE